MLPDVETILKLTLIGIGATICMDIWAQTLKRLFAIQALNWGLVGRWIANMRKGQFIQTNILKAEKFTYENTLGWGAHYGVGIIFAFGFAYHKGFDWVSSPDALSAWLFGISTVVFPFFIMQPGLGLGIAASKTPDPVKGRFLSCLAHSVFGLGMFASAWLLAI